MVDVGSVVCNVVGIRGLCCGRQVEFDCLLLVNMLVDMETWGCLVVVVLAVGKVLWDVLVVVLIGGWESRGCGVSLLWW